MASLCLMSSHSYAADNSKDPFETYNRSAYRFNRTVDQIALKPIAKVYDAVLPGPAKKGVLNFFDNLNQLPTLANNLLQANLGQAVGGTWRFAINSTLGVFGFFDVASRLGIPKYSTDFGITLQKWGVKSTPYLVLPILGSSTFTDTLAIPVDFQFNPLNYVNPKGYTYGALGLDVTSKRAEFLKYGSPDEVALDPYVFQRNVYLQRREALLQKARGNEARDLEAGYDFADTTK